jgi:hypothetical protein
MAPDSTAVHVAAILNAAYMVRHHRRPLAREQRASAITYMATQVRAALARSTDDEALLYAVAVGLYDQLDARFFV